MIGEVRGLGPMLALELTDPQRAAQAVVKARAEGLLLLTCGPHGQVIGLLPSLTITDAERTRGPRILERALN